MLQQLWEAIKMMLIVFSCGIVGIVMFHFFIDFMFRQLMKSSARRYEKWEEEFEK